MQLRIQTLHSVVTEFPSFYEFTWKLSKFQRNEHTLIELSHKQPEQRYVRTSQKWELFWQVDTWEDVKANWNVTQLTFLLDVLQIPSSSEIATWSSVKGHSYPGVSSFCWNFDRVQAPQNVKYVKFE